MNKKYGLMALMMFACISMFASDSYIEVRAMCAMEELEERAALYQLAHSQAITIAHRDTNQSVLGVVRQLATMPQSAVLAVQGTSEISFSPESIPAGAMVVLLVGNGGNVNVGQAFFQDSGTSQGCAAAACAHDSSQVLTRSVDVSPSIVVLAAPGGNVNAGVAHIAMPGHSDQK